MIGDMQNWTPNVAGIIEHAKKVHPTTEIISRLVSGEIHRSNYEEVCIRSRKLASVLEKRWIQRGRCISNISFKYLSTPRDVLWNIWNGGYYSYS